MEKKGKLHLTNEDIKAKFRNNFDLVNYAIKLAENMIKTGREPRVKSEIQNRAMLILGEIQEGKDQFDELRASSFSASSESHLNDAMLHPPMGNEERSEKRKYRTAEIFVDEE